MMRRKKLTGRMMDGVFFCLILLLMTSSMLEAASSPPNGGWDPLFSPDGKQVAFISSSMHMPGQLWIMNADGFDPRPLASFGVTSFSWAKDGGSLFFSRWGERTANLSQIKTGEAGTPHKIPVVPDAALSFSFSPGRTLVAYLLPSGSHRDLWVKKTHGDVEMQYTNKFFIRSITWSPDGKNILFLEGRTYGEGIWAVDLEKGSTKVLVKGFCNTPVYSPQGDRFAYVFPWKMQDKQGKYGIRIMNSDGSGAKEFDAPHMSTPNIQWNPDGSAVSYLGSTTIKAGEGSRHRMTHTGSESSEQETETALWQLDLKNGREHRLSPAGFTVGSFSWSSDGKTLILGGADKTSFGAEVWRMDAATGKLKALIRSRYGDWLPTPSPDTTRIAYLSNRNRQGLLVVTDETGKEIRRFDPFPIEPSDRLVFLNSGKVLFLYNSRGYRIVDLGEHTRLDINVNPKFEIVDLQTSLQEQKILLDAVQEYGKAPRLTLLTGEGSTMKETELGGRGLELQPRWSIDGKKIAYTDGTDLWTMDPNGKNRKMLTYYREMNENPGFLKKWIDRLKSGATQSFASDPFWSPDGSRIGYILTVYDREEKPGREIWWITVDGSSSKRVYSERIAVPDQTLVSDETRPPFFDIDGERIVFTSMIEGLPNLRSVNLKDQSVQTLTRTGALFPALLPERDEIVYTSIAGNEERLMTMELDGSGKRLFLAEQPKAEGAVKQ